MTPRHLNITPSRHHDVTTPRGGRGNESHTPSGAIPDATAAAEAAAYEQIVLEWGAYVAPQTPVGRLVAPLTPQQQELFESCVVRVVVTSE